MQQTDKHQPEVYHLEKTERELVEEKRRRFLANPYVKTYAENLEATISELNRIYRLRGHYKLKLKWSTTMNEINEFNVFYVVWTPDNGETTKSVKVIWLDDDLELFNKKAEVPSGARWILQVNARHAALSRGRNLERKRFGISRKADGIETAPLWNIAATPMMTGALRNLRKNLKKHKLDVEGGILWGKYPFCGLQQEIDLTANYDIYRKFEKIAFVMDDLPHSIVNDIKGKSLETLLTLDDIDLSEVVITDVEITPNFQGQKIVLLTVISPIKRAGLAPQGVHDQNPIIAWLKECRVKQMVIDEAVDRICNHGQGWQLTQGEPIKWANS